MLALTGSARSWEPKRLRLRLFSITGRLTCGGRRLRLRLVGAENLCHQAIFMNHAADRGHAAGRGSGPGR
jgi:hypothetical protein